MAWSFAISTAFVNTCYVIHFRSKLKYLNFEENIVIAQEGMETRPVCTVHAIDVTSCHGNDDKAWSTSCLIMQYKPYIVDQLPVSLKKLLSLHKIMQVGGVQSYKTDDRDREHIV